MPRMSANQALAERLNAILRDPGMRAAAAHACDVSEQGVAGWLKTGRIDKRHLPKLARLCGCDLNWLLTGEGSREPGGQADPVQMPIRNSPLLLRLTQMIEHGQLTPEDLALLERLAKHLAKLRDHAASR